MSQTRDLKACMGESSQKVDIKAGDIDDPESFLRVRRHKSDSEQGTSAFGGPRLKGYGDQGLTLSNKGKKVLCSYLFFIPYWSKDCFALDETRKGL